MSQAYATSYCFELIATGALGPAITNWESKREYYLGVLTEQQTQSTDGKLSLAISGKQDNLYGYFDKTHSTDPEKRSDKLFWA